MNAHLFDEFCSRGLLHQSTDAGKLKEWLTTPSRRIYAGFDPTADSLHVGHLVALVLLRRVAAAGHEPVALIGGATGMVGDPSGRSEERNLLSTEELAANVAGVEQQIRSVLSTTGGTVHVVNNAEWTKNVSYLEFLRDVGKHVPLTMMLGKDSVKSRLEREGGLSYTEFSYMLLQAWDFVHLSDALDCRVQIGGSDQWGNITAGIELGRRLRGRELHGMTCPLLTKADGTKMGKTASGAVWLDPKRTSPFRFFQYWMNLDDSDAGLCIRRLTEVSLDEVRELDTSRINNPSARETQQRLAEELTRLVHGDAGLAVAQQATGVFFGGEIEGLDEATLLEIFAEVPSRAFPLSAVGQQGLPLVEALQATGLASSRSQARRTIEQGGAYVNNRRIRDVAYAISLEDLANRRVVILRSGKKSYALARFSDEA
jgi:tyrosyl-tRNA synthetase